MDHCSKHTYYQYGCSSCRKARDNEETNTSSDNSFLNTVATTEAILSTFDLGSSSSSDSSSSFGGFGGGDFSGGGAGGSW